MVQYAALNLACLHARFGHARLASCALDEAVRVAQQRHDHACVTFALGWLRYVDIREAEYEAETYGADSASRGAAVPSRHRRDSCPSDEVVGGFFFDFGAVRTASRDRNAPRRPKKSNCCGKFLQVILTEGATACGC